MSAPNQGRQSPPPEEQTGAQQRDPPANGHGVNENSNSKEESIAQLESLESNPKGPLDDHVKDMFTKTMDPSESSK